MRRCSTLASGWRGRASTSTVLPVEPDGLIDLDLLERELDERVALVAVMLVNNEIGVIQPVAEIADMAHEAGALMLCDAVQAFGRRRAARRARPGRGLGAQDPRPQGHWRAVDAQGRRAGAADPRRRAGAGLRSGTLSPALCVGFGAAAKLAAERDDARLSTMSQKLWDAALHALGPGWTINGSTEHRYHGNLNIRREGVDARAADRRPARHRFLARQRLRQRVGPAEPCAPGARPRLSRGALVDPPRFRPLHDASRSWSTPASGSRAPPRAQEKLDA